MPFSFTAEQVGTCNMYRIRNLNFFKECSCENYVNETLQVGTLMVSVVTAVQVGTLMLSVMTAVQVGTLMLSVVTYLQVGTLILSVVTAVQVGTLV